MIILNCSINVVETETDPHIYVWTVSVQSEKGADGEWCETFGSIIELRAFVQGLKAAISMTGVPAEVKENYTSSAQAQLLRL